MKRLLPLGLALACAFVVPQAQGNNCNRLQPCLERCAKDLADCQDTDYICKGENTNCKKSCQGQHEARISTRGKKISQYARDCIWANYPEMQGAINLINRNYADDESVDDVLIDYAMYPDQGYYSPRGISTSIDKISSGDMDTPHYWLLLKIYNTDDYNVFADKDGNPGRGVPPPPYPPSGVWFFAKGLRDNNPDSESDLLKALYIAAVGDPAGAEAIIDGTFMDVPGVRERAEQWRRNSPRPDSLSEEGALHYAYLLKTLVDTNEDFVDRELVDLSLGILPEYYHDQRRQNSNEMNSIYKGGVASELVRAGRLAGYHYRTNNNTTSFPLNADLRD